MELQISGEEVLHVRVLSLNILGDLGEFSFVGIHQELKFPEHPDSLPFLTVDFGYVRIEFLESGLNVGHGLPPLIKAGESFVFKLHVVELFLEPRPIFPQVLYGNVHLLGTFLMFFLHVSPVLFKLKQQLLLFSELIFHKTSEGLGLFFETPLQLHEALLILDI